MATRKPANHWLPLSINISAYRTRDPAPAVCTLFHKLDMPIKACVDSNEAVSRTWLTQGMGHRRTYYRLEELMASRPGSTRPMSKSNATARAKLSRRTWATMVSRVEIGRYRKMSKS